MSTARHGCSDVVALISGLLLDSCGCFAICGCLDAMLMLITSSCLDICFRYATWGCLDTELLLLLVGCLDATWSQSYIEN